LPRPPRSLRKADELAILAAPRSVPAEAVRKLRRTMVDLNPIEAMETLVAALRKHKTNDELLAKLL
jgi:transcription termination factor Rho